MILPSNIEWRKALQSEFVKPYFVELCSYLEKERESEVIIYPKYRDIFRALDLCPPQKVKVVILGQDPYHEQGQACGLSFSVPNDVKTPPSLKNIFKELSSDLGILTSGASDLSPWEEQGVLLLNSILTVRAHEPGSHRNIGWIQFTDHIISYLSANYSGIVFLLWGNYAQSKAPLIDSSKHLILKAAHPSPLARGAFFGSHPFSQANTFLKSIGKSPIDWKI